MTTEEKIKLFETELSFIVDDSIRDFTMNMISVLPEYFFEIPASSTGKYHPAYALGEQGLVRHTKAAVRIANELSNTMCFERRELDCCIAALILHDGCKNGINGKAGDHTVFTHPLEMVKLIYSTCEINRDIKLICELISTHMGRWVINKHSGKQELDVPETYLEFFVHMCDYLASRKCIEFNFEV